MSQPSFELGRPLSIHGQRPVTPPPTHVDIHRQSASSSATILPPSPQSVQPPPAVAIEKPTLARAPANMPVPVEKLGEPSKAHFARSGMIVATSARSGHAAKAMLARGGDNTPNRWEEVDVPEKYGLWAPELKKKRWGAIKKAAIVFPFLTIWLWICLPFFWGSTYQIASYFPNLAVEFVTFDEDSSSFLNMPLANLVTEQQGLPASTIHMGWVQRDASDYPNGLQSVQDRIIGQEAWAVVVVNSNATSAWRTALENGDSSYDPQGAIGIYFASARFYQVTLLYIQQLLESNLAMPLSIAQNEALKSFAQSSTGNSTALSLAASVPQAIGSPFGYYIHDIRSIPNGEWSAAAPMEASLIYFVIFAFYIAMYGGIVRMKSGMKDKLRFKSMLVLRLGWPLIAYFFMSLWQTLVVRAFQVQLDRYLGHAGFVTLWALNYVTLIAGGFAMETVLAIVGPSFLPIFLILWLIINITSSFFPLELMPTFYRFLRWGIFMHNVEGYKIIAFGTDYLSKLGYHFGILFAIIGVELIGLPASIFYERWAHDRAKLKAKAQQKKGEEEKQVA